MSVLVKGMKMPMYWYECPFCCDGYCFMISSGNDSICLVDSEKDTHRNENCPLIELPPHGRLIVEDDAIETAWMILAGLGYRREENPQLEQTVREVYATAPTIEVE